QFGQLVPVGDDGADDAGGGEGQGHDLQHEAGNFHKAIPPHTDSVVHSVHDVRRKYNCFFKICLACPGPYTLKRNRMMSPSWTMYSLPSERMRPFSRAAAIEPQAIRSS